MDLDQLFIEENLKALLPKDQLNNYIRKYHNGDKKAGEIIILHNMRLVLSIAKKFRVTKEEYEELVSVGFLGLIKSIDSFDIKKNIEFSTFAGRCIENEMLIFLRWNKKYKNSFSLDLDKEILEDTDFNYTFKNILVDENVDLVLQYEEKEIKQEIRKIVSKYSGKVLEIIILYFGFNIENKVYTQKQIAEKLYISQSSVSNIIARIINEIGEELKSQGLIEIYQKRKTRQRKFR